MAKRTPLVCQQLENISRQALERYQDIIYSQIEGLATPFRPFAEHCRIVAGVHELMVLFKKLGTKPITTVTPCGQLLEATIPKALEKRLLPEVCYEN